MFNFNDRFLKIAKKVVDIATISWAGIGGLSFFILLIMSSDWSGYAGIAFASLAVCGLIMFLTWFLGNLSLSRIVDVKLIRNKLYGEDNYNLNEFLVKKLTKEEQAAAEKEQKLKKEKLAKYKTLLNSGIITQEEYDNEVSKLN